MNSSITVVSETYDTIKTILSINKVLIEKQKLNFDHITTILKQNSDILTKALSTPKIVKVDCTYKVVLYVFSADKKIQMIKAVREVTKIGLKEAKDLVESLPKPLIEHCTREKAEEIKLLFLKAVTDDNVVILIEEDSPLSTTDC